MPRLVRWEGCVCFQRLRLYIMSTTEAKESKREEFRCERVFLCGSNFPFGLVVQWLMKLEAEEVAALSMCDPDEAGLQAADRLWRHRSGGQWRYRNFQREIAGARQAATGGQQNAAGADVESGGKLKKFLPLIVDAAHENRNRQGEALMLTSL